MFASLPHCILKLLHPVQFRYEKTLAQQIRRTHYHSKLYRKYRREFHFSLQKMSRSVVEKWEAFMTRIRNPLRFKRRGSTKPHASSLTDTDADGNMLPSNLRFPPEDLYDISFKANHSDRQLMDALQGASMRILLNAQ